MANSPDDAFPDWSPMPVPTEVQLLGVWGRTSSEAYAVGWDGTILRWDGFSWGLESTAEVNVPLTDVAGTLLDPDQPEAPTITVAVGWDGTVLSRNQDGTWSPAPQTVTTTASLSAVHLAAPDRGLAVGDAGTVLAWDGVAWTPADFAVPSEATQGLIRPTTALAGTWSEDGNRWVISGAGGASYRSAGVVSSFEILDTRESIPFRGVWGSGAAIYTVGLEGVVLRLTNRWRRDSDGLPDVFMFGIWGRNDADITAVGWRGTIARRIDGEWQVEASGTEVDLRDVWVDAETGFALAVGPRGTILTRTSSVTMAPP